MELKKRSPIRLSIRREPQIPVWFNSKSLAIGFRTTATAVPERSCTGEAGWLRSSNLGPLSPKIRARASAPSCGCNHETSWELRTLIPSSSKLGVPEEVDNIDTRMWLFEKQGILRRLQLPVSVERLNERLLYVPL